MAQFKVAEITESIIIGVSKTLSKILLPRVRKMIREEIDRGMKDIMLEVIKSQGATQINDTPQLASTISAKETIAKRQHKSRERARKIVERNGTNDPLLDMVLNAEDPQEEQQIKLQEQLEQPMVSSRDVDSGDVIMPENIDFGDRLEKLGIS